MSHLFKIPEVGLELGLAELRLEYFRDRFDGGDLSLACRPLGGRARLSGLSRAPSV